MLSRSIQFVVKSSSKAHSLSGITAFGLFFCVQWGGGCNQTLPDGHEAVEVSYHLYDKDSLSFPACTGALNRRDRAERRSGKQLPTGKAALARVISVACFVLLV